MNSKSLLTPVRLDQCIDPKSLNQNQWGNRLAFLSADDQTINLEHYDLAIVGVSHDWENGRNEGSADAPNHIRHELYKLNNWHNNLNCIDLGNIKVGTSQMDSYAALSAVVVDCLSHNVIPIILGGTHDLTYGQYMAYGYQDELVNMAIFDEKIDLESSTVDYDSSSFLYKILSYEPNMLNHFSHAGFQYCLNNPDMEETLRRMHFDCYRLGELVENANRIEPIVRNCDIVSIDMSVVKFADAQGQKRNTPTGMTGEDICRLSRFAGISDRVSSFGIYEYFPHKDDDMRTAQLAAQMVWHFADGFYGRKNEYPELGERNFMRYIVPIGEQDQDIVFLKSKKSDRWWMKVPAGTLHSEDARLIPCLYEDYLQATREDIPDRWMNSLLKYAN